MSAARTFAERARDVRRWLAAAEEVYARRAAYVQDIVRSTRLSLQGVELGFESLERGVDDEAVARLVARTSIATRVHVILSANVFVAPLRAIALARAAAPRVTVRPSPRDPVLARALVQAARDPAVRLVEDRDVASIEEGEIHVYGRDATVAAVRARARAGVLVRGHGAGMGAAVVGAEGEPRRVAAGLAADVVAFDQRGCLSPRVALVEGGDDRAALIARALFEELEAWETRIPRGELAPEEAAEARRWRDASVFAGPAWMGASHAVTLIGADRTLSPPPPGRHVAIAFAPDLPAVAARLAPLSPFVVAVGTNALERVTPFAPPHARLSVLGRMQRPALDGPVDLRSF